MRRWAAAVAIVAGMAGCGGQEPPSTATPATSGPTSAATPAGPASSSSSDATFTATVKVVDKDGTPLPGMMPIATRQPNAFDKPLARGALTDASGAGTFDLPNDESLYIRAWDPQQRLFANNYFEALPADGNRTPEMTIVMYPATRLDTTLIAPDGKPLAGASVGLMLSHPTLGPWWPSEAKTDGAGRIVFAPLPPGQYIARMKAETGETLDLPEILLMPGEPLSLPSQSLQRP